ncbi:hypothetical protein BDV23DRAFT_186661 [Aspergillus alliaceus]|uniref:Ankyrin repeat-containing domain protein n=1 Tax=Petromyces alliaceus TaxID=209559 RepID=A0A5N7BZ91_PETAA|nr:hypothetical protein BDV23DRAFT_186661 [Aspergillus alliaceus]
MPYFIMQPDLDDTNALYFWQTETLDALINAGADIGYLFSPRILRLVANDGLALTLRMMKYLFEKRADLWRTRHNTQQDRETIPVQAFLDYGIPDDLDDQPEPEPTLSSIFMAIMGSNTLCLQALVELGCSITQYCKFESGTTTGSESIVFSLAPIHLAASQLRPWHLALLLQHGDDPELRTDDEWKQVPLHLACVAYQKSTYKFPDAVTADSELVSSYELEPTDIINARLFMIQILVTVHRANVNTQDAIGRTALMVYMTMPYCLQVIEYLMHVLDAKVDIIDHLGQT